jgi:hypothetical protein
MSSYTNNKRQLAACSARIGDSLEQVRIGLNNESFISEEKTNALRATIQVVDNWGEISKAKMSKKIMDSTIALLNDEDKRRKFLAKNDVHQTWRDLKDQQKKGKFDELDRAANPYN